MNNLTNLPHFFFRQNFSTLLPDECRLLLLQRWILTTNQSFAIFSARIIAKFYFLGVVRKVLGVAALLVADADAE